MSPPRNPAVNYSLYEYIDEVNAQASREQMAKRRVEMQWRMHHALYGHGWGRYHPLWEVSYPEVFDRVYFQHDYLPVQPDGWFPLFSEMMGFDPYAKIINDR